MSESYVEQWKILRAAKAAGWPGESPPVLGGYYADKAVAEARQYLKDRGVIT